MTILPATLKNCLGVLRPKRLPTPPARMTAMLRAIKIRVFFAFCTAREGAFSPFLQ